jgi:hypothetical protein
VESCPRATKGFPRKRNRDAHMSTRHNAPSTVIGKIILEQAIDETLGTKLGGEDSEMATTEDMIGLELKLRELEREKIELDLRQSRVDEDIKALKRTIQLVAT